MTSDRIAIAAGAAVWLACAGLALWAGDDGAPSIEPEAVAAAAAGLTPAVHYAPAENLEGLDVEILGEAGETIDMAAYVLTDGAVIDALAQAADRGVKIRIVREASQIRDGYAEDQVRTLVARPGVEAKTLSGAAWMHLKSYVVDRRRLRTGSANFSASGLKRQDNDLVVISDEASVRRFESAFEALWRRP